MFDKKKLGARIQSIRTAKGLKQTEVAKAAGFSNRTLSDIERGKREPNLSQLIAIGYVLEADLNYLCRISAQEGLARMQEDPLSLKAWDGYLSLDYEFKGKVHEYIDFMVEIQDRIKNKNGQ